MGSEISLTSLAVYDNWDGRATIATGAFDKVDVTAYSGSVLVQVLTPNNDWQPPTGRLIRAGIFRSVSGYTELYPPGPTQLRFKRAVAGIAATVDVDVFAPDQ